MTSRSHIRSGLIACAVALLMVGPAFAQIPAVPPPPSGATVPFNAIATAYAEDFEFSDGGYTTGGAASWQHGQATAPPTTVVGQGPGMWGTNLAGDYGNGECGWMQSAPIDLTGYTPAVATGASLARLAYRQWLHTESGYDAGIVLASADGESWQVLTPTGGYDRAPLTTARTCLGLPTGAWAFSTVGAAPAADAWSIEEFDVTAYLGGMLHVRWFFATDSSVVKRGWYVDDVIVQIGAGASASWGPIPVVDGVAVPFMPVSTLYAEDFEGSDGGWTVTSGAAWEWGAPAAPPITVPGSLNVWGTRLLGNYQSNECSALATPAISIPGANPGSGVTAAQATFKMWYSTESGFDAAVLQASVDGGNTWTRIVPATGYDRTLTSSFAAGTRACLGVSTSQSVWSGPAVALKDDEWNDVTVDLTPYMGKSVMLRFVFGSDGDTEARGVYVDDFVVNLGAGATADAPAPGSGVALVAPGWTVTGTNPSWAYGMTPASNLPAWATGLTGNYNSNECSAIVSPPIVTDAVPGLGRLTMHFKHAMRTTSSDDGGLIQVSADDGATWTTVTPVGGYSGQLGTSARACLAAGATVAPGFTGTIGGGGLDERDVRLDAFQGETIRVRFAFGSGSSGESDGWTVSGVTLSRGAGILPVTPASSPAPAGTVADLLAKADPALQDAILAGQKKGFEVIVLGTPHVGVTERMFATRADAARYLDTAALPFTVGVSEAARVTGAEVTATWPVAPAVKVVGDLDALLALAGNDDVRQMALDYDGAIRLIEPIPGDDLQAENTQGRKMIQAEEIWALGFRGEGIKLAIIDTGIDGTHEAFKHADGSSRIIAWADYVNSRTTPYDDNGHGTHVAGTSAGSTLYNDPTFGVYQEEGVAPRAQLMGIKFLSSSGSGSFENALNSLNFAFNNGADITSNSWGASSCSAGLNVIQLVRQLTDLGMLSVFAAGNSGPSSGTIGSPGCSESALTVGAVDNNMAIASFSSRGPCSDPDTGTGSRICPDVVAKGVNVRSAAPRGSCSICDPSGYDTISGTSMATPHIGGAAVLAEQMKRFYTGSGWDTAARAEEQVFKSTTLDLGAAGEDSTFGWGLAQLLNIYALLDATDEANIVSSFGVSVPVLRQGDSTRLSFSVRNLGGAAASGTFRATLTDPLGAVTVLKESAPTLGLLDGESYATTYQVGGSVMPGTYTFRGTFDYTWTNTTSGEVVSGSVAHEGVFDVKKVFVSVALEGYDAETIPGDLQQVTVTAKNTGNEPASALTLEFTVPDDYVFVPGEGFDPANPNSRYASPTPVMVREDKTFGRVTLVFNVGSLGEGSEYTFRTNLLPTTPGEYRSLLVAKYKDGAGKGFSQGILVSQTIGLPEA